MDLPFCLKNLSVSLQSPAIFFITKNYASIRPSGETCFLPAKACDDLWHDVGLTAEAEGQNIFIL